MFFASTFRTRFSFALAAAAAIGATLAAAPARAQPAPTTIEILTPPAPQVVHVPVRSEAGPRRITDWESDEPIPAGYRPVLRARKGLVIAGATTFGATYLTSALAGAIAADSGTPRAAGMLIPVVGPLTLLGEGGFTGGFFLVMDTLAQAAGVTMFAVGMARQKPVLVRAQAAKIEFAPAPMSFGQGSAGFGLVGRF